MQSNQTRRGVQFATPLRQGAMLPTTAPGWAGASKHGRSTLRDKTNSLNYFFLLFNNTYRHECVVDWKHVEQCNTTKFTSGNSKLTTFSWSCGQTLEIKYVF